MSWASDPGGNFDTDVHRRVACAVANLEPDWQPLTLDQAWARVQADDFLDITYDDMVGVLNELSAAGAVTTDPITGGSQLTEAARGVFDGTNSNQTFVYRRQGEE